MINERNQKIFVNRNKKGLKKKICVLGKNF